MLHVVPAGMFEAKNRNERWSVKTAVMREMLEEVYNEEEQQGEELTGFEDDIVNKKPLQFLSVFSNPKMSLKEAKGRRSGFCPFRY